MWWPRPCDPPDLDGGASGRRTARTTRNGRTVHFGATVLIWTGCGSSMAPKSGRCYAHAGEPTVLAAGARSGAAVRLSEPADASVDAMTTLNPATGRPAAPSSATCTLRRRGSTLSTTLVDVVVHLVRSG